MPARPVSAVVAILAAVAVALGAALVGAPGPWASLPDLPPPVLRSTEVVATAVATLDASVKVSRSGRVVEVRCAPGDSVSAGDPLVELKDLALQESKRDLQRQVLDIATRLAEEPPRPSEQARQADRDLRLGALRHLEETHAIASKELARWTELHEQGLAARLDFEQRQREFDDLSEHLRKARVLASETAPAVAAEDSPELRRSRRLLEQLERLPETFLVKSPWDGTVQQMLVSEGAEPGRGEVVATISRSALPRLEAGVAAGAAIAAVASACGIPGPLPFTLRDETLGLLAPSPRTRPGDNCRIVILIRE